MLKRLMQRCRHSGVPFQHWLGMPDGGELMALDCETTGLDVRRAELVSVAAVPIRHGRARTGAALDLRLRAPASLDAASIRIHRLRSVDLSNGLEPGDALEQLIGFIGNRPLVGWCLNFDLAVINRYSRARLGFDLPNPKVELSELYRRHQQRRCPNTLPDLRFDVAARQLGVPLLDRHSARGDATTAALMYLRLKRP